MAKWDVQTQATDADGKCETLGQIETESPDRVEALKKAKRIYGEKIHVSRASHLVYDANQKVKGVEYE